MQSVSTELNFNLQVITFSSGRDFSSIIKYENVKRIYPNKQLDLFLQFLTAGVAPNHGNGARALFANQCKYCENSS